ncbi:MAG: hypothetical protein KF901_16105 [Myxococcales bacterium]|nr:hypothetical protein [Myxococcales bacterium]
MEGEVHLTAHLWEELEELALRQPPGSPTEVELGVYLIGISRISPPSESFPSFEAELFLEARWRDPRLAFDPDEAGMRVKVFQGQQVATLLEELWWPALQIENEEDSRHIESRDVRIRPDGTVEYEERSLAKIHAEVDLRRFPFDTQALDIVFASFSWDARHVRLVPLEARVGWNEEHHTLEWNVRDLRVEVRERREARSEHPFSELVAVITVERDPGFYLWKLVVPLLLITMLAWTTFWMSGEATSARMQRTFIAVLSVVAFHKVIADNLPRISYLTFLDGVVYLVFAITAAVIIQIILVHRAERAGQPERSERLDRTARWLFPLIFTLALVTLWVVAH